MQPDPATRLSIWFDRYFEQWERDMDAFDEFNTEFSLTYVVSWWAL